MVVRLPDSCIDNGNWTANSTWCPNCRERLRVSISEMPCCRGLPSPHSPLPLTFKQPNWNLHRRTIPTMSEKEKNWLLDATTRKLLLSGWYYMNLDWQGAQIILKEAKPGSYLIRDSGDKNFMFSLSVQTQKGPTSVRLHREDGLFRLDCDMNLAGRMKHFRCVVDLVQFYSSKRAGGDTVWVDQKGCPHSPVLLSRPLRRQPPSLAHSARLALHRAFSVVPKIESSPRYKFLPLPPSLIEYLGEYPYTI